MRTRTQLLVASLAGTLAVLSAARVHAVQVEAPYTKAMRYDANGQLTGSILPDPDQGGPLRFSATRYTYTQSLLTSIETGELTTWPDETVTPASWASYGFNIFSTIVYSYDSYGRKATESLRGRNGAAESLTQYGYDGQNRIQCKTVRMNPDAFGTVVGMNACVLGPEGTQGPDRVTRFTYDTLDQVLTEERAVGTSLQQTYVTNTYTGHQLDSRTDANGNRTELHYDGNWRLYRRYFPSPTTPGTINTNDYEEYGYEANDNLRTDRKRNGTTITYSYDQNNRRIDKVLSDHTYSDDVHYDYDLRGLTRATYFTSTPDLGTFTEFDGFGRAYGATTTMRLGTGTVSRALGYDHDNDGSRTRVTHPDGTYFEYAFDGRDRVRGVTENGAPLLTVVYRTDGKRGSLLRPGGASTNLGYDNAGRLGSFTQDLAGTTSDLTNTFGYNAANQFTRLTQSNSAYTYAGNDNLSGNYARNGLNQYTIVNGQQVSHDANGNLTSDGTLTYNYDMENRLVGTAGVLSSLKYDPLGRMSELVIVPGSPTQFLYDGDALVAEYSVAGNTATLSRRYVHGDSVDEPLVQYYGAAVGASARRYLHEDHQGSVIAQTDSTGGLLAKNAYDAFGIPAGSNIDRFGFTGQTWLAELGLNYYKARMYSPRLGRFLQTDPIGYEDDLNLYAYVYNDPLSRMDPFGHQEILIMGARPSPILEPLARNGAVDQAVKIAIEEAQQAARGTTRMPDGQRVPTPQEGESPQGYQQRVQQFREQEAARRTAETRQPSDRPATRGPPSEEDQPLWFRILKSIFKHDNDPPATAPPTTTTPPGNSQNGAPPANTQDGNAPANQPPPPERPTPDPCSPNITEQCIA